MSVLWDTAKASELARKAYGYLIKTMPKDANLDVLAPHEDAALEAQRAQNFPAYEEVLRQMCRVAKREAIKRRRAA
jgi:hypothetical protein